MIMLTYDEEYGEKFSENHEDDKNYDDEITRQDLLVSNDLIIAWVNRCGTPAYQTIVKVHHFFSQEDISSFLKNIKNLTSM